MAIGVIEIEDGVIPKRGDMAACRRVIGGDKAAAYNTSVLGIAYPAVLRPGQSCVCEWDHVPDRSTMRMIYHRPLLLECGPLLVRVPRLPAVVRGYDPLYGTIDGVYVPVPSL